MFEPVRARTRHRRPDGGFTIFEILVVVIVMGILATAVVLAIRGIVEDADTAAVKTDAKTIERAEESFHTLHARYATEQELLDTGVLKEPSTIHDIVLESDGSYRLVRVDDGSQPATTAAPVTTSPATTVAPTTSTSSSTSSTAPSTTSTSTTTTAARSTTTTVASAPAGVTCTFTVKSAGRTTGTGVLVITNGSSKKISSWTVRITLAGHTLDLKSATGETTNGATLTASNTSSNGKVGAGEDEDVSEGTIGYAPITKGMTLACVVSAAA